MPNHTCLTHVGKGPHHHHHGKPGANGEMSLDADFSLVPSAEVDLDEEFPEMEGSFGSTGEG